MPKCLSVGVQQNPLPGVMLEARIARDRLDTLETSPFSQHTSPKHSLKHLLK
jgi:hypothetical protein